MARHEAALKVTKMSRKMLNEAVLPPNSGQLMVPMASFEMLSKKSWLASNPKKKAEYDKFIKSATWRNISHDIKKQANGYCGHCKRRVCDLEVHHLTYERFGGKESRFDLIALCPPCHVKADEERIERQEAAFEAQCEETRYENGYATYMTKKYGEHYELDPDSREEFDEWLRDKQEDGYWE